MESQMNMVQNAARLAMADHRAATPLPARRKDRSVMAAMLAGAFAALVSLPAGWGSTAAD